MSNGQDRFAPQATSLWDRAGAASRSARWDEAARLLDQCLALAPQFTAARQDYAVALQTLGQPQAALAQIAILLRDDPENLAYREFEARLHGLIGDYAQALAGCAAVLAASPANARAWLRYGHLLRTVGRVEDAVAAYRKSLEIQPSGEGWWSLADLKTIGFSDSDVAAMRALLEGGDANDRIHLHFALGKALADRGDAAVAFAHYEKGNAGRRSTQAYNPDDMTRFVDSAIATFTADFFSRRGGHGCPAIDPIFIVGLPRSGSTLVEQILASHSSIEGTMELADMIALARGVRGEQADYPAALAACDPLSLRALGEAYLKRTRIYRQLARVHFIDKMPNNFIHVALIHLVLPNARIIDVRRDPLDCCVSGFRQHFAAGQEFSYGLDLIGRYHADYVRLMAHFESVLPGRIHRVIYERLVADPQREISRLLEYCGLPFEPDCLRFHENPRPVRTASSQQVRRPISTDGIGSWRMFEPWLGPLKAALGAIP